MQLEVLRVARADLQHHAGRLTGDLQRAADLVDLRLGGDLHRDHADAVLPRELEHERQACRAVALEVVGARARLVGARAGGRDACAAQRPEGVLEVLARVHRADAGEEVEAVLAEVDAVVLEAERLGLAFVAADRAVALADPDHLLDRRELLERLGRDARGGAEQVDLGQGPGRAANDVQLRVDVREALRHADDLAGLLGFGAELGLHHDDHGRDLSSAARGARR